MLNLDKKQNNTESKYRNEAKWAKRVKKGVGGFFALVFFRKVAKKIPWNKIFRL